METVSYRISDGNSYGWDSYGPNAYMLDSWDSDHSTGYSIGIVFDTVTQTVYEMTAGDYRNNRAYRWVHPNYREAHIEEAKDRVCSYDTAWDDVKYVDLEVVEDILEKSRAIVAGVEYDTRVSVPLDLSKDELYELMSIAHERDITLNQLVESILLEVFSNHKS